MDKSQNVEKRALPKKVAREAAWKARKRSERIRDLTRWGVGIALILVVVGGLLWIAAQSRLSPETTAGAPLGQVVGAELVLPATTGDTFSLGSLRGKRVVLYFYEGAG